MTLKLTDLVWYLATVIIIFRCFLFFPDEKVSKAKSIDKCWPVVYVRMVCVLLNEEQFDLALRITLDMIQSEAKQDMNFIHLDLLDSMQEPGKRPKRPEELSINYALTK